MNRRIKKTFDARGIEIPFPHRTIYWGEPKDGAAPPTQCGWSHIIFVMSMTCVISMNVTRVEKPRMPLPDTVNECGCCPDIC